MLNAYWMNQTTSEKMQAPNVHCVIVMRNKYDLIWLGELHGLKSEWNQMGREKVLNKACHIQDYLKKKKTKHSYLQLLPQ